MAGAASEDTGETTLSIFDIFAGGYFQGTKGAIIGGTGMAEIGASVETALKIGGGEVAAVFTVAEIGHAITTGEAAWL